MSGKQIRTLGIVLVGLALLALLLERPWQSGDGVKQSDFVFAGVEAEKVHKIVVENASETVTLERADGDNWLIAGEFPLPADTAQIHRALRSLPEISTSAPVARNPEKHDIFGVDDESGALAKFFGAGDDLVASMVIGKNSRSGSAGTYFRLEEGDEVYQTPRPFKSYIVKTRGGWRDRRIFNTDPAELVKLRIERGDSTIVFEQDAEQVWQLREPEAFPVKRDEVTKMLNGLARLICNDLPDSVLTVEETGLDEPFLKVTAETIDGRALELAVGNQTEAGMYFCKPGDRDWIYTIAKYRIDPYYTDLVTMKEEEPAEEPQLGDGDAGEAEAAAPDAAAGS